LHTPVLLKEVIESLNLHQGDIVVDATLGLGGHAKNILEKISPNGVLVGIDRDAEAIKMSEKKLSEIKNGSFRLVQSNFRHIDKVLEKVEIPKVNGILFDLGISSHQLAGEGRGFSFMKDSPLDMRMNRNCPLTASEIINKYPVQELERMFEEYGEIRKAHKLARYIAEQRKKGSIATTGELREMIYKSRLIRRKGRIHPATTVFQALRIEVNEELASLSEALNKVKQYLAFGARICIISFHSLEDRIAKQYCRNGKQKGFLNIITKKPLRSAFAEIKENPRARSAKLRVAEYRGQHDL